MSPSSPRISRSQVLFLLAVAEASAVHGVDLVVRLVAADVFDALTEHGESEHEDQGSDGADGVEGRDGRDGLDDCDEEEVDVGVTAELPEQRHGEESE